MATHSYVAEAVDRLSDALNTLDDFDKFWREYNEGRLPPVDSSVLTRDQALEQGQATRVALVHYIFDRATKVRESVTELLQK